MKHQHGLGCAQHHIAVYIANRPPIEPYCSQQQFSPLVQDEITTIGQQCGNGWRKVFNVYAKLLYALNPSQFNFSSLAPTWQIFRDHHLLQTNSHTALFFSPPQLTNKILIDNELNDKELNNKTLKTNKPSIHIIIGRTYARSLLASGQLTVTLDWLDDEFAINREQRVIVCPYFDYRQLSNVKIARLALMIEELNKSELNHSDGARHELGLDIAATPSQVASELVCPQCLKRNQCGISAGRSTCWCFNQPRVEPELITEPIRVLDQCLCSKCLNYFSKSKG
ncbi:MAG: cysteine-rich CWC family protein [Gammaproteobacteria bacterium]|nr:cysteine-rich CWC family protein [Gammaproteobacteria bacterium]